MHLRHFFYMQKSDRRAIIALLLCLLVCGFFAGLLSLDTECNPVADSVPAVDSAADGSRGRSADKGAGSAGEACQDTRLFVFDPNTADSVQLARLGLRPQILRNILRYRSRGGVFTCKEDFARLYGLTVGEYRRFEPYIRISEEFMPASSLAEAHKARPSGRRQGRQGYDADVTDADNGDGTATLYGNRHARSSVKIGKGEHVFVNTADTNALKTIPGIGSYFARCIVKYRERLGGYVSVHQLREIDDFPQGAMEYIRVDVQHVRKLRVNELSVKELKRHPYISYYQATAIADYRRLHGKIKDIAQLRLLREFSDDDIARLRPYMEY